MNPAVGQGRGCRAEAKGKKTATSALPSGSGMSLVSRGILSRATGGLEDDVGEPRQTSPESERRSSEPAHGIAPDARVGVRSGHLYWDHPRVDVD